jgi:methionine synthase II (cobalamin-independent)
MPIPVELVGSFPRPSALQKAYEEYDAGKISNEQFKAAQEEAVVDTLKNLEKTGHPILTDGEQRISSFATYPLTDTLMGTGLAEGLAPDGQFFAIFDDGHHRQLPRLTKGPFKYKSYAVDNFKQSSKITKMPMKQAVIAPSMLYLLYPLDKEIPGYTREEFANDLVNECEKDIRLCFEAGAKRVSVDFTEGRLASKKDPRNPWTGREMLQTFIDLNNRVFDRFSPAERANIGVHTCPGGDCDSVHSIEVPYSSLLPSMFNLRAGYFLIQLASEPDKEAIYKQIGQHLKSDQVAFIGVIDPLNPRVETPEEVAADLVLAAEHIPKERLGATDDCGFSPFSIDVKPKHGSPDFARETAWKKVKARVDGAKLASEKLGI